ncbi:hypothetical protein D6C82_05023 [Aureobasidium pullulans]|nr:hypothetical protein D6C82_05023 [Aureobasidium pullulans]
MYVIDSDSKLIALRLATANTTRRRKFRYWSKHADKLAATEESLQANQQFQIAHDGAQPGESSKKTKPGQQGDLERSIITTTEATEVITGTNVASLETESVASIATTAKDLEGHVASLPPPPKLTLEGKDFHGMGLDDPGGKSISPTLPGAGSHDYISLMLLGRAHVIRDLEPYVCTYVNCSSGDVSYGSRADWLDHENTNHRAIWKCIVHNTLSFSTELALKTHLQQDHVMTKEQIDNLAQISRFAVEDKRTECPVCLRTATNIPNFTLHLANHMERIATFALPRNLESDDDKSLRSDKAVPHTGNEKLSWISGSAGDSESEHSLGTTKPLSLDDYSIGWVVTLPVEMTAAVTMLDEEHEDLVPSAGDSNLYHVGRVGPYHNVVIACPKPGRQGFISAGSVVPEMLSTFPSVKALLIGGIGSGVPNITADIRLGDVVVGLPGMDHGGMVQFHYNEGRMFVRTGSSGVPSTLLSVAFKQLQTNPEVGRTLHPRYLADLKVRLPAYARPVGAPDWLFRSGYTHAGGSSCSECRPYMIVHRPPRQHPVHIHYGTIASGNLVIKDTSIRDRIGSELALDVLCIEMAAAGLPNKLPCLVVKGISDYADSHKTDQWQRYAAASSAAYIKELILTIPAPKYVEDPTPHTPVEGLERRPQGIREELDSLMSELFAKS